MQPANNNDKRKRLSNILIIIAISLAFLIVLVLLISTMPEGSNSPVNANIELDGTPTPYGTEVITPFYTPTAVPTIDPATVDTPVPTAAPTPTMVPISLDKMYKKGDQGEEVLLIQKMLIDIGFDPGGTDGDFGDSLKSAVKNFQLYENLDYDGIVGSSTLGKIISNWQQMSPKPLVDGLPLEDAIIGIDPGHQQKKNADTEPISPNSTTTKAKTSAGTYGRWTDVSEYIVNLQVALRLKIELEALGATVIIARETHDVNISNVQRAQMMSNAKVDCWLRVHANGSDDEEKSGMFMLTPADGCMDTQDIRMYERSARLAQVLLSNALQTTGANSRGVIKTAELTGFNWSKEPVCLIEMGHMTNEAEDNNLVTKAYQQKIIDGLVNGFVEYFTGS